MDWNDKQRIGKVINGYFTKDGADPPVRMDDGKSLNEDLLEVLEVIFDNEGDFTDLILDPSVHEWYQWKKAAIGRSYVKMYRDTVVPNLARLKREKLIGYNATMLFLVMFNSANDGIKVNRMGMKTGELCKGNKRLAKEAGIHESLVPKAKKQLVKVGLIQFRRRLWKEGPHVYFVNMGWHVPPTPKIEMRAYPAHRKVVHG